MPTTGFGSFSNRRNSTSGHPQADVIPLRMRAPTVLKHHVGRPNIAMQHPLRKSM